MPRAESVASLPQLEIASSRNLMILAWYEHPSVDSLREIGRAGRALGRQFPAGTGCLNLMVQGTPKFTDEVRDEAVKLDRDPALFPLGIARVILLPGLTGLAVRVFLNTISLVSRHARPVQAFTDLGAGAAWLAPKLSVGGQRWASGDLVELTSPFTTARPGGAQRGAA